MRESRLRCERHPRALVVDDEELVRGLLARATADVGFEVATAASVEQALALLRADPEIDLLVTDLTMPTRSGLELIDELRQDRPHLPCLLVSGTFTTDVLRRCQQLGVHVLSKPTGWQELQHTLERIRHDNR